MPSPRSVETTPQFRAALEELTATDPRLEPAVAGVQHVIARTPDLGMAVPNRPGFHCCPAHTETSSALVVYRYDDATVTCIALRRVPSGPF